MSTSIVGPESQDVSHKGICERDAPERSSLVHASEHSTAFQWAIKSDWNKQRARLGELYERLTLPEVMQIMKTQYNFRAT